MKTKNTKKIVISIIAIVLALLIVGGCVALYFLAVSIYDGSFNYRCTSEEEISFDVSEFPGLTRERHTFTSNKGQTLVGYLYEKEDVEKIFGTSFKLTHSVCNNRIFFTTRSRTIRSNRTRSNSTSCRIIGWIWQRINRIIATKNQ